MKQLKYDADGNAIQLEGMDGKKRKRTEEENF